MANKSTKKNLITFNKTQQQIVQQKIEAFIEDISDFDQIYIEVIEPEQQELVCTLLDKKALANILSKDMTCDYQKLII